MSNIRKQAERLVELYAETAKRELAEDEWGELEYLLMYKSKAYARAYLAEREAHERTKKRLASAMNFIDSLNAKRMIITSDTFGDGVAAAYEKIEDMATKVIASIEQKGDDE